VQEENFNGGAFQFAENRVNRVLGQLGLPEVRYVGRRAVAATAVGSSEMHKREAIQLAEWIKDIVV
jgi:2-oxoglutarate dehydrogenase complex dehydrogenase (E1) component-like enzyme